MHRWNQPAAIIGDSFTVGYGNTSPSRQCSPDTVWATTDTSQGFAPRVTAGFDADYQVNAASGRGVVRHYDGFSGDTIPEAYPFVLFDKAQRYQDADWKPQWLIINLGTNDFYTALRPVERWASREALRADYEQTFVHFLADLRVRFPDARILLGVRI